MRAGFAAGNQNQSALAIGKNIGSMHVHGVAHHMQRLMKQAARCMEQKESGIVDDRRWIYWCVDNYKLKKIP